MGVSKYIVELARVHTNIEVRQYFRRYGIDPKSTATDKATTVASPFRVIQRRKTVATDIKTTNPSDDQ